MCLVFRVKQPLLSLIEYESLCWNSSQSLAIDPISSCLCHWGLGVEAKGESEFFPPRSRSRSITCFPLDIFTLISRSRNRYFNNRWYGVMETCSGSIAVIDDSNMALWSLMQPNGAGTSPHIASTAISKPSRSARMRTQLAEILGSNLSAIVESFWMFYACLWL